MKLKKKNNVNNNIISIIRSNQAIRHNKKISMDDILNSNENKNIYVNKVLKKSLGKKRPESEFSENIPNFHSNIRSILSNEENREKAIKYIVNMRKRIRTLSPIDNSSKYLKKNQTKTDLHRNEMNIFFSQTANDRFYTTKNRKKKIKFKNLNLQDINNTINYDFNNYNCNDDNKNYKKEYYIIKVKNNSTKGSKRNLNINREYETTNVSPRKLHLIIPERVIKVNKINKYNIKKPYNTLDRNMYDKNRLFKANSSRLLIPNNSYNNLINNNNILINRNNLNCNQIKREYMNNDCYDDKIVNLYNNPFYNFYYHHCN